MTFDVSKWMAEEKTKRDTLRANFVNHKRVVFAWMMAHNITHVVVYYDGSGDSGQIEGIHAYRGYQSVLKEGESVDWPKTQVDFGPLTSQTNAEQAFVDLAWRMISIGGHDGFENNDGGYGEIIFSVPDDCIKLEHNDRIIETVRSEDQV